jgi:integrase
LSKFHTPQIRQKKGRAVVVVPTRTGRRKEIALGPWQSKEANTAYANVLKTLAANEGRWPDAAPPTPLNERTITEVALAFVQQRLPQYRAESKEPYEFQHIVIPLLVAQFGPLPAIEFTPKRLKLLRETFIAKSWCRTTINRQITRVKTIFKWAAEEELVPGTVHHALTAVRCLPPLTPNVKEPLGRPPAFAGDVAAVLPHLEPTIAIMLQVQWLTGCRSGEIRIMRLQDLDRSNSASWLYHPGSQAGKYGQHKNAWRGQTRTIVMGPQAIALLSPLLVGLLPTDYLFSPQRDKDARCERKRSQRKSKVQPSQNNRKQPHPKKVPSEFYSRGTYAGHIRRACAKVGIKFTPYSLRHGRKMDLESRFSAETARAQLGQKSIQSTTHYGHLDLSTAAKAMREVG